LVLLDGIVKNSKDKIISGEKDFQSTFGYGIKQIANIKRDCRKYFKESINQK